MGFCKNNLLDSLKIGHFNTNLLFIPKLTPGVDSEVGCSVKPLLDLLDPGQVDHEGGSGARPEVDDQRLLRGAGGGHAQQAHRVPGLGVMELGVGSRVVQHCCLVIIIIIIISIITIIITIITLLMS